jgi:hypothetical protein
VASRARIDLAGTAKNAVSVTYQNARYPGLTSFAAGAGKWKARVSLRPGLNVITFTVHGVNGTSKRLKVTVVRK